MNHRGFTLIEVLVSLFVLTIGLLGLVSLQTLALKHNNHAYYRSVAVMLAEQMADNLRANANAKSTYLTTEVSDNLNFSCVNKTCSVDDIARYDVKVWAKLIANALPVGAGRIESSGDFVKIMVSWKEANTEAVGKETNLTPSWVEKTHQLLVNI